MHILFPKCKSHVAPCCAYELCVWNSVCVSRSFLLQPLSEVASCGWMLNSWDTSQRLGWWLRTPLQVKEHYNTSQPHTFALQSRVGYQQAKPQPPCFTYSENESVPAMAYQCGRIGDVPGCTRALKRRSLKEIGQILPYKFTYWDFSGKNNSAIMCIVKCSGTRRPTRIPGKPASRRVCTRRSTDHFVILSST